RSIAGLILREGRRTSFWASVSVWPGHQDPPKRSHREGGAKSRAWDGWRVEEALHESEDSVKLNTSFVERLNLTIRQGSAYLDRRTICHARWKKQLEDHLEL